MLRVGPDDFGVDTVMRVADIGCIRAAFENERVANGTKVTTEHFKNRWWGPLISQSIEVPIYKTVKHPLIIFFREGSREPHTTLRYKTFTKRNIVLAEYRELLGVAEIPR